ncbi:MAG: ATP-binding protein [Rubrivivax sp.]|nr:ATP-binding protein [Rubrivivax sp.]
MTATPPRRAPAAEPATPTHAAAATASAGGNGEALVQAVHGLIARADALLARLSPLLPPQAAEPDWRNAVAFRLRRRGSHSRVLEAVRHRSPIRLADLKEIDGQKERLVRNTEQFVAGRGANNVLLSGARGTGKSSLIKACLNEFAPRGLRVVEVDKADLVDLPDLVDLVAARPERFIVYCDDLSFDEGEPGYKALKSVLDGSVAQASDNVLIYATSNRRHLLPEYMDENLTYKHHPDGEVHPGEVVEEKISLSERFGLWISFYPFTQDEYLTIVAQWLRAFGVAEGEIGAAQKESLVWALERGSRSGRVAQQFARDYAARHGR